MAEITVKVTEENQNKPKHVGNILSFFAESKNLTEIVKDPTDLVVEKSTSRIINEDSKKELLQYEFPKGLKLTEKMEKPFCLEESKIAFKLLISGFDRPENVLANTLSFNSYNPLANKGFHESKDSEFLSLVRSWKNN